MSRDTLRRLAAPCIALAVLLVSSAAPRAATVARALDPLVQDRDTTVSPGADFFEYACGGWVRKHPIPPSEAGWGIGNLVQEQVRVQLRSICEAAAASGAPHGSVDQKVGDFWLAGMDSARADRLGAKPLAPWLAQVDAIADRGALARTIGEFQRTGFGPVYGFYVVPDERNSEKETLHLAQGGIGLPDRDYYFAADTGSARIRREYRAHVAAMFRLLGESAPAAARSADAVWRIERLLASRSRTIEQLRDPWANYHPTAFADLQRATPDLAWTEALAAMRFPAVDTVIVGQPEFLAVSDSLVKAAPLADWKAYLRWNVVGGLANRLGLPFEREEFHFYATVLRGTKVMRPRWKRVLDAEEGNMGELMGQAWVARYCSPATKARYEKLTQDVVDAYRERIRNLAWMSDSTKARALEKLEHVGRKVGYPDSWRDFSTLQLGRDSYADNQVALNRWWFDYYAAKIGKPVDHTKWDMSPQTYNAYYDPSKNEMVLPAAAFVIPGVPDSLVDDATLYGYAAGSTIGHEITHGFDDEGRQFDAYGNMNPWWTPQDSVQFNARTDVLVKQFDRFVVSGKHVRGRATLGENLADLGGIRLGYEAFKKTAEWKAGTPVNGLTPDQRYFLGYALSWLDHRRPQALAEQIMSNVHSPYFLRVNGPLSNVPEFFAAFGIKPGDKLWRPEGERVSVW